MMSAVLFPTPPPNTIQYVVNPQDRLQARGIGLLAIRETHLIQLRVTIQQTMLCSPPPIPRIRE